MKNKFLTALLTLAALGMVFFSHPIQHFLSPYSVDSPGNHEYSFRELSESLPADLSPRHNSKDPIEPIKPMPPTQPIQPVPPIHPIPPMPPIKPGPTPESIVPGPAPAPTPPTLPDPPTVPKSI